jgi:hypothetical protein
MASGNPNFEGPNAWQVREFVHKAVRLPTDVLAQVHSRVTRGDLSSHAATIGELLAASSATSDNARALRILILQEAWTTRRPPGTEPINPDWVAEAVTPAAQALMEREVLEKHPEARRRAAYHALMEPFKSILE